MKINGGTHYLWRAADHEGEWLESYVTKRRDRKAALKFLRKLVRKHGQADEFVTDQVKFCGAALRDLNAPQKQCTGRWMNYRAENSHQPFRQRKHAMLRFRRMRCLQKFVSVHAAIYNHFNQERSLSSRDIFKLKRAAALTEWRGFCAS